MSLFHILTASIRGGPLYWRVMEERVAVHNFDSWKRIARDYSCMMGTHRANDLRGESGVQRYNRPDSNATLRPHVTPPLTG